MQTGRRQDAAVTSSTRSVPRSDSASAPRRPRGARHSVARAWAPGRPGADPDQALLDQLGQGLTQALAMGLGLDARRVRPTHRQRRWRRPARWRCGRPAGFCRRRHIGLMSSTGCRRAGRCPRAAAVPVRGRPADHRLADAVGSVGGAGGEHPQVAIAAQARRTVPAGAAGSPAPGWKRKKQQPDMADAFQPFDRLGPGRRAATSFSTPRAAGAMAGCRGMANFSLKQERTWAPMGVTLCCRGRGRLTQAGPLCPAREPRRRRAPRRRCGARRADSSPPGPAASTIRA